jgi:hypothetical protein
MLQNIDLGSGLLDAFLDGYYGYSLKEFAKFQFFLH